MPMRPLSSAFRILLGFAAAFLLSAPASALTLSDLSLTVSSGTGTVTLGDLSGSSTSVSDPNWTVDLVNNTGAVASPGPNWELDQWQIMANSDPAVAAILGVVNLSASTRTFTITFTANVGAQGPSTVTSGRVTDAIGSLGFLLGKISTVSGTPLYTALIDGVPVNSLLPDPFSATNSAFNAQFGGPGTVLAGLVPAPTVPGPAVSNTIGIQLTFNLDPGAAVGIGAAFVVEPVPEPTTVLLLAFGLGGLAVAGSRLRS
jgi:hypothetical protein